MKIDKVIKITATSAILVPFVIILLFSLIVKNIKDSWVLIISSYVLLVCGVIIWAQHLKRVIDEYENLHR